MTLSEDVPVAFRVDDQREVSGLLRVPPHARAAYVLAHGAGAGMKHPFLAAVAVGLAERGIATLRYQFPYMEAGGRRPDPPKLAQAAVRAAVGEASQLLPGLPLVAGGKSFGGRMTSQAQAASPLQNVRGLVFLGFPLHPAGRPSRDRGDHLFGVTIPMLFVQGTRDALAHLSELEPLCAALGPRVTLSLMEDADHSFRIPAKSAATGQNVMSSILDAVAAWLDSLLAKGYIS